MTAKAVEYAEEILQREGVKYKMLEMPLESESEMVATVFKSRDHYCSTLLMSTSFFHKFAAALNELGRKKITGKVAFRFGSYGWSVAVQRRS